MKDQKKNLKTLNQTPLELNHSLHPKINRKKVYEQKSRAIIEIGICS